MNESDKTSEFEENKSESALRSDWKKSFLFLLPLLIVTFLLYSPTISLPFMTESYVEQSLVQEYSPADFFLASAYLEEGSGKYYRFGSRTIDWLVQRVLPWGRTPQLNRLFQIFQHLLCVSGIYCLLLLMTDRRKLFALIGASILALHPSITGAVVLAAVRWTLSSTLLFLAGALLIELIFRSRKEKLNSWPFICLSILLFFLSLVAEIGALGMGILGLWTLGRWWQNRTRISFWKCLLPLSWVPCAYLIIRKLAIGNISSPYIEVDHTASERIRITLHNIVYDLTLFLEPVPQLITAFGSNRLNSLAIIFFSAIALGILIFPKKSRQMISRNYLPVLGLGLFALFQLNALWRIPKSPIWEFGIDRGYVYYLPVALLALFVGVCIKGWEEKPLLLKRIGFGLFIVWCLFSILQTHRSLNLWVEGGRMMQRHEEALRPHLTQLPEGSRIHLQGFPDALRQRHLPWVLTYYFMGENIMEIWGGKEFDVTWDLVEGNDSNFEGLLLRESNNVPEMINIDQAKLEDQWNEEVRSRDSVPNPVLIIPGADYTGGISFEKVENAYRIVAENADPSIGISTKIDSKAYGYLRGEIMLESLPENCTTLILQLYFSGEADPLSEARSVSVPLASRIDEWQEITIPLYKSTAWIMEDEIVNIRLDPIGCTGTFLIRDFRISAE